MKLENQVCSLELSKKLKELNVKQDSLWKWVIYPKNNNVILSENEIVMYLIWYSAFTVAELGEMLPEKIQDNSHGEHWFKFDINNKKYIIEFGYGQLTPSHVEWNSKKFISEKTEANARAKMLIYLIENKLMEVNK